MSITQPTRRELPLWVIYLMATAVATMATALAVQDRIHRAEISVKDSEMAKCQEERTREQAAFRAEITALYREVQEFREEIYQQSQAQQRRLKKRK